MRGAFRMLAWLVLLGLLAGCGKSAEKKDQPKAVDLNAQVYLNYVSDDHLAGIIVYPKRLLEAEELQGLPLSKMFDDRTLVPIDPREIEQIVVLAGEPQPDKRPPMKGLTTIIRFTRTADLEGLLRQFAGKPKPLEEGDVTFLVSGPLAGFKPDDRTCVFADLDTLKRLAPRTAESPRGPLAKRLEAADPKADAFVAIDVAKLRSAEAVRQLRENQPPEMEQAGAIANPIIDAVEFAQATIGLSGEKPLLISLESKDAESAERLTDIVKGLVELGRATFNAVLPKMKKQADPEQQPAIELAESAVKGIAVTQDGTTVTVAMNRPKGMDDLNKVFGPALDAAEKQAQRSQSLMNLRIIGFALHNHNDVFQSFPTPAIVSADGKPLLSWRVAILPFLDEEELHKEFRLDEPWDSEHNKKLLERIPEVYQSPGVEGGAKTRILAIVGEKTLLGPATAAQGQKISSVTDGMSNTIAVVEAGPDKAVPWTKPEDIAFDEKEPIGPLGAVGKAFPALFGDVSVHTIKSDLDAETLGRLFNARDGQPIDWSKIDGTEE